MRRVYLDTSALIPIYREEKSTGTILGPIKPDDELIISELNKIEFKSALCRTVRLREISNEAAHQRIMLFEADLKNFRIQQISSETLQLSANLLDKYSVQNGLRSLDAIHLASAIEANLNNKIDFLLTLDRTLATVAKLEGLNVHP